MTSRGRYLEALKQHYAVGYTFFALIAVYLVHEIVSRVYLIP
jgi:hypothetical protein